MQNLRGVFSNNRVHNALDFFYSLLFHFEHRHPQDLGCHLTAKLTQLLPLLQRGVLHFPHADEHVAYFLHADVEQVRLLVAEVLQRLRQVLAQLRIVRQARGQLVQKEWSWRWRVLAVAVLALIVCKAKAISEGAHSISVPCERAVLGAADGLRPWLASFIPF